jgi:hypothetical protein
LTTPWLRLGLEAWSLGLESSQVIGLRALKLASGGVGAGLETQRMVSEKIEALMALQARALTGDLGATPDSAARHAIAHYRRKVRANRRRLAKP